MAVWRADRQLPYCRSRVLGGPVAELEGGRASCVNISVCISAGYIQSNIFAPNPEYS